MTPLRVNVICQSNMNRSMAAHKCLMSIPTIEVTSSGIGQNVKIPGPSANEPNHYSFGTPYAEIEHDLLGKNPELYTRNSLLAMLRRNKQVKPSPQNFRHLWPKTPSDVLFTFDERVFDLVTEYITVDNCHVSSLPRVHIFNLTVHDNAEAAERAAELCCSFLEKLSKTPDWETRVSALVEEFVQENGKHLLHVMLVLP
eukprot:TRINITY_DN73826_c0_g1_i1.p1 TRINITY_DN73826_c0_g1~~TRINITY_DN73826_c0_g1_i1.p1  ORF type:complete len:199 (+),score=15.99 TRINITY_DN73826_c0_g1_i1:14-610(+)